MKIIAVGESLIEWPGNLSFIIFIAGCNFRCPFCYVPHLVLPEKYGKIKSINEDDVLKQIEKRKNFIDAVCITGGEPTIHAELVDFLKKIKAIGIKIRLETNGSNPSMIRGLIKNKLIDSIAMDIKNSKEKYSETCGIKVDIKKIRESIRLIKDSHLDYEFRTTLVPRLHSETDIIQIAKWINSKNYILQQFRSDLPEEKTVNPDYIKKENYPLKDLEKIREELKR